MADLITVKITGVKELLATLKGMGEAVAKGGMQRAAISGGLVLRDAIRASFTQGPPRSSPGEPPAIDQGYLKRAPILFRRRERETATRAVYTVTIKDYKKQARSSLGRFLSGKKVGKQARSKKTGELRNVAGTAVYGRFLEFGTSKMRARPFITPAYFNNKELIIKTIKETLKQAIVEARAKR